MRKGRWGDSSYDMREELAKEAYYERKYPSKEVEVVEVEEIPQPSTLFETLSNTFRPTINIDNYGKSNQ